MPSHTGYAITISPAAPPLERDTFTCAHCCKVVIFEPRKLEEKAGYCGSCGPGKHICLRCAGLLAKTLKCTPLEKVLQKVESGQSFAKALGIG